MMKKWLLVPMGALVALAFSACFDAPGPGFEVEPGMEKEAGQVADGVVRDGEQDLPSFGNDNEEPPFVPEGDGGLEPGPKAVGD